MFKKRQVCPLNRSFVSVSYLLNQWMDFHPICIDTLLGEWKKIDFILVKTLFSRSHQHFGFSVCYLLNQNSNRRAALIERKILQIFFFFIFYTQASKFKKAN